MRRALTNWRAGCGKTACPVRREGWSSNLHPYPYGLLAFRAGCEISGLAHVETARLVGCALPCQVRQGAAHQASHSRVPPTCKKCRRAKNSIFIA